MRGAAHGIRTRDERRREPLEHRFGDRRDGEVRRRRQRGVAFLPQRRLQLQHEPVAAHDVGPVVRVDAPVGGHALVGGDREERSDGVADDPQPLDARDGGAESRRAARARRREFREPIRAEPLADRPRRGERRGRFGTQQRRVDDGIAGPARRGEELVPLSVASALQHDRGAFGGVAVLVQVGAHARHAGHAEVPRGQRGARGIRPERQHETPDARVDVQRDARGIGRGGHLDDGVERGEGVVGGREHDERDVVVEAGHDIRCRDGAIGCDGHEIEREVEVRGRLLERRVHGARGHEPGAPLGMRLPPYVTRRLDCEQAALGASARGRTDDIRITVQQLAHETDELRFEHADRAEGRRVEPVDGKHLRDGGPGDLVEFGEPGVVHVAQHTSAVGGRVVGTQVGESGDDGVGVDGRIHRGSSLSVRVADAVSVRIADAAVAASMSLRRSG
ncbi:hypothetical protein GCM10025869_02140 [Homoserinibacter gongjuensis]|uniref:Uncharacterized protein n=1 Tax=Homoserinibacter gongjuensis TaxID=1162968 RepID=A0ABQ6JN21_9MICO|nr:hypothetical protein GCM10025869_02140 [Homoserinibacter gongjuensis]